MDTPRVVFDRVSKRFVRGERHDSLRDLIPALVRRAAGREARDDDRAFWAVRDVSFEVQPGEALGIIGRNGAGKSTILKLLNRILKPTTGSCRIVGRAGALIEIAAGFHPDLTGRENVYLQGAIMGMRRAEIASRFDAIVDFAGIEPFIDTPVKRYSSGMNARLGFSIAAHLSPDVLLIDEVLAVGDMAFQTKCYERMRRFRDEGVAIVFVSHNLAAVAHLCTKVLLLDAGTPVALGPPPGVIAAYCSGQAVCEHDEVTITAALRAANARPHAGTVEIVPGDRLSLDATITFRRDVARATVGVVVWDLTRELYVYGATSEAIGMPPIEARADDVRAFTFSFDANLTRGLYAVEINIFDPDRQQFLGVVRGIQHFQVVEQISFDGVANLYLVGRERTAVPAVADIRPALAR